MQFLLPTDVVVAKEVTRGAEHKIVPVAKIPNSWSVVDIGPQTTEAFMAALEPARTVFWNGPLGVFEVPTFGDGTRAVARKLAAQADAGVSVVVGGGDSVAAVEELGLAPKMTHISTGGGASLEFMEGRELPGIAVLLDRTSVAGRCGMTGIAAVDAHEILDSRGNPTLEASRRPRVGGGRPRGGAIGRVDRRARGGRVA